MVAYIACIDCVVWLFIVVIVVKSYDLKWARSILLVGSEKHIAMCWSCV